MPIHSYCSVALTSLNKEVIDPSRKSNPVLKQKKQTKSNPHALYGPALVWVQTRHLTISHSYWGEKGQAVQGARQSRAKYHSGWDHLGPCQTLPTWCDSWRVAAVFQGWAKTRQNIGHAAQTRSSGQTCHKLTSVLCPRGCRLNFIFSIMLAICPTGFLLKHNSFITF